MELAAAIPHGIDFADLQLSRDAESGAVLFNLAPIEAICDASGLDLDEVVNGEQPLVALLICAWYEAHLERGGKPDPVQDDLLKEMQTLASPAHGPLLAPGHA